MRKGGSECNSKHYSIGLLSHACAHYALHTVGRGWRGWGAGLIAGESLRQDRVEWGGREREQTGSDWSERERVLRQGDKELRERETETQTSQRQRPTEIRES